MNISRVLSHRGGHCETAADLLQGILPKHIAAKGGDGGLRREEPGGLPRLSVRERESKDSDRLRVHVSKQAATWSSARLNDPLKDSSPVLLHVFLLLLSRLTTPMWLNQPLADSLAQSSLKCWFIVLHGRRLARLHTALQTLLDLV